MVKGAPVETPCPQPDVYGRCQCGKCLRCGWPKHMAVHGGVIGKPGMIWDHKFQSRLPREPQGCADK